MQLRLETLDKNLSNRLLEIDSFSVVQDLFRVFFFICFDSLDENIRLSFFDSDSMVAMKDKKIPSIKSLRLVIDELDEKYFDAEEKGLLDLSEFFFKKARIVTAIDGNNNAENISDLNEALYEALMATDKPQEKIKEMSIYLRKIAL